MGRRFKRKVGRKKEYSFIYIFTEGQKTEPTYFRFKKKQIEDEIRQKRIKIEINKKYKGGYNTISLVDLAIKFISDDKNSFNPKIDECWVVFDKDDFDKDFDNAINKAEAKGLKVAYSNEAFELWFLLHFNFMESAIKRNVYNTKIEENYQKETGNRRYRYDKSKAVLPLINLIKNREKDAIRNAKNFYNNLKTKNRL